MTKCKFSYPEDNGVKVLDILNVVNPIHNETVYLKYDTTEHQYQEKTMVYKLQNNVIKSMLKQIFEYNGDNLTRR